MRSLLGLLARTARRLAFVLPVSAILILLPTLFAAEMTDLSVGGVTTNPAIPLSEIELSLEEVAEVEHPIALAHRHGDDALFIASKHGLVQALRDGRLHTVLDLRGKVAGGYEQGLLGLAFTPDGRQIVVNFTDLSNASRTRVYPFEDGRAVTGRGSNLITVPKKTRIHNAGTVAFGPDGYLYVSLGDGGESGDPTFNAQSLDNLFGTVMRVEVRPDGSVTIPKSNPFVRTAGARPEIWAYGFRNPWRFSFDRVTGDLWIADVGRRGYEEISHQPSGARPGRNYGWNHFEGPEPFEDPRLSDRPVVKAHVFPVHAYPHEGDVCAVTGGYVYRGKAVPGLDGAYIYTDFCLGGIRGLRYDGRKVTEMRSWDLDVRRVSSFGEGPDGELYVLALQDGIVYRLVSSG